MKQLTRTPEAPKHGSFPHGGHSARSGGIASLCGMNIFAIEQDGNIIARFGEGQWMVKGTVVKVIDTASEADDRRAGLIVAAELERLRGELKNPDLDIIQLTHAEVPAWTNKFAIFAP